MSVIDIPGILRGSLSRAGISQQEAARLMCISPQYLCDVMAGRRRVTPEMAALWAAKVERGDKVALWRALCILGAEADGWDTDAIAAGKRALEEPPA